MTHRLLILFLSGIMAFGATTVRADRRIGARVPLAEEVHLSHPVSWEILAGCPEAIHSAVTTLETGTSRTANPAGDLTGDELAMHINRLEDGLDEVISPLDGDAIAQSLNQRNEGLAAGPAPAPPDLDGKVVEASFAPVSPAKFTQPTHDPPKTVSDSTNAVSHDVAENSSALFNRAVEEGWSRATVVATSPAMLHLTQALLTNSDLRLALLLGGATAEAEEATTLWESLPCCGGYDDPRSSKATVESLLEIESFVSCAETNSLEENVGESALETTQAQPFNDPHSASPSFDEDLDYGCDLAPASLSREIDPVEQAKLPVPVLPFSTAPSRNPVGSIRKNAELYWESHQADVCGVWDWQEVAEADSASSAVSQSGETESDRGGVTYKALSVLARTVTQPIDQAAAEVTVRASQTLRGALHAVYRSWHSSSLRAARRPVPYVGL